MVADFLGSVHDAGVVDVIDLIRVTVSLFRCNAVRALLGAVVEALRAHDPKSVGPYRLLGRLGAGGMGQVYLGAGRHDQRVAIKVVHPGLAHDDRFRSRFRREVEVSRQVTGPWVAAVVDADADAPTPWLATQYVRGPSLATAVETGGPLSAERVHALAHGLAMGLAAVHGAGLVHRDLKPSNVLLDEDHPRLIDFGISRAVDGTRITSTGVVIGTPAFMSPEQIAGHDAGWLVRHSRVRRQRVQDRRSGPAEREAHMELRRR